MAHAIRKSGLKALWLRMPSGSGKPYSTTPTHLATDIAKLQTLNSGPGGVNAFVSIRESGAASSTEGMLAGAPIAIKDNICTKSFPTTCSSNMLDGFQSPYDATVVRFLQAEGAQIIGKTNCDEFGMGSMNTYSSHGPVVNPYQASSSSVPWRDRECRSAGGSSGGSAAAVAADMCFAALSTDTGGSTRLPASYCGIVGLKPSYGLLSRWGVVSFADSLDCVGIMANTVSRVRTVFDITSKFDSKDPTSIPDDIRSQATSVTRKEVERLGDGGKSDLHGLTIGVPQEYFPSEMTTEILTPFRNLLSVLQSRGAILKSISLPSTQFALSAYYVLASAEASSNLARYDGIRYGLRVAPDENRTFTNTAELYAISRSAGFGPEVKRRILLGTYALTADAFDNYFLKAQRVRSKVREDFDKVFRIPNVLSPGSEDSNLNGSVDIILHPSAIQTAPLLPSQDHSSNDTTQPASTTSSGLDAYVQDVLTVPASLAGIPALSVPMGLAEHDGWPIGVSVVGQWGSEELVMRVGEAIERENTS